MPLQIAQAILPPGALTVTFLVPGHEIWTPRTVRALADRGAGGAPNRSYMLTIGDGQNIVAQVGAADAGTDPGSCDVTWANMPAASSASGALGVTVAPLGPFRLPAGYLLTATIDSPAAGDQWTNAICWYDYAYSA